MYIPNPPRSAVAASESPIESPVSARSVPSVWQQALAAPRAPVWPAILATVCAAGLLLAFQQVVQASVQQGEARTRTTAALADAVGRCDAMRDAGQRANCHAQLNTAPGTDTAGSPTEGVELVLPPAAVVLIAR